MEKDFPTNTSNNISCVIREHTYINEFTSNMSSLGITDYPQYYYLGWIRPENLPSICKTTRLGIDGTGDNSELVIAAPEYNSNIPIGYFMDANNDLGSVSSVLLWERTGGDTPVTFTTHFGGTPRFINKFYPEYFGLPRYIQITFLHTLYDPQGNIPNASQNVRPGNKIFYNYQDFLQFCKGNTTITDAFSYTPSGGTTMQMSFTFTGTDFASGTCYLQDDNESGYESRYWLTGVTVDGMFLGGNSGGTNRAIVPMFKHTMQFTFNDDQYNRTLTELKGCNNMGGNNNIATIFYSSAGITNIQYYSYDTVAHQCGSPDSTVRIPVEQIKDGTQWLFYQDGIIIARIDNNAQKYVKAYCKLSDIENYVNLFVRVAKAACVSYISGMSYATNVSADDEFLAELKTGDIEDAAFRTGLREWQYVDLEYDPENPDPGTGETAYDPDDMPPYDPTPTPEGEEGHNPDNPELSLGDTEDVPGDMVEPDEHRDLPIQFPVSAFMTQYVLDANQIYNMGRALWSGMGDSVSQMASNFVKTYTSTGTINIANLMDFFVSVKCFPFDMTAFNYGWQANAMTVGTGAVPILNESVWVLGVSTYTIDCGTVSTTDNAFKLGVNSNAYDFRNYVNCTISCFLPFCGTVELNPADVFPYTLSCKYFVDMLSGSCTAVVWAERPDGEVPVASKTGQIGKIVPISATNVMGVVGQAISGVSNIFQSVGEVVISAAKRRALGATQAPINEASKNKEYLQEMANYNKSQTDISNKYSDAGSGLGVVTGAVSGIGNLMTRNGVGIPSLGAGVGLEAMHISERPYIVIRRLNYSSPNNYAHTTGFATTDGGGENNKPTIGSYSGWTVFQNPDLSGIVATKEELDEIKYLLETGVYL